MDQMGHPLVVGEEKRHAGGMPEKAQRRRFSPTYKRKVLAEAAQCRLPGELGALLRREGLYSSHLAAWRAAERRGAVAGPAVPRGPAPRAKNPLAPRVAQLERQLAAVTKRAERAEAIVAVQKKVAALLGEVPPSEPS